MQELSDGRMLLEPDEVKVKAEEFGLIPVCMTGSSFMKIAKKDKIPENFEPTDWDTFFSHLDKKNCAVCLMPGSTGYMKIQNKKTF